MYKLFGLLVLGLAMTLGAGTVGCRQDEPKKPGDTSADKKDKKDEKGIKLSAQPARLTVAVKLDKFGTGYAGKGSADLDLKVDRGGYTGEVKLKIHIADTLPEEVNLQWGKQPLVIPANENSVRVQVTAVVNDPSRRLVLPQTCRITISSEVGSAVRQEGSVTLEVTVAEKQ